MRQASRRSWRIGQTRPVKVVYMAYRNTLQADALKLVAKKLQSSLAVEGELPEDGLAAYGDDGDDLMMALARKIVSGEEDDAETVEQVFAQARNAEADAEELLVDDDWKAVEPGAIETVMGQRQRPPRRHGADPVELVAGDDGRASNKRHTFPQSTATEWHHEEAPGSLSSRCSPGPSSWPMSR